MFKSLSIDPDIYQKTSPYPYTFIDNFLNERFAKELQDEIFNIPKSEWDRYENPFEKKFTLRDKFNFPNKLKMLFDALNSDDFVKELSKVVGYELYVDETRNFWGVHKYENNDKLDIHVDAGLHPTNGLKKQITLGLYLSKNWKDEYGCKLQIWKGDNSSNDEAKIYEKVDELTPKFNRLIIFTCNDYSWHGNPEPTICPEDANRLFLTLSYLSKNFEDKNKRVKAFFVPRPTDIYDTEKDKLRFLRADPQKYKDIYNLNNKKK